MLLPLDALKIKRQVNPEAFRGRGVVRIFMEEGTTLYRGWGWTMARNAPGSFAVRPLSSSLLHSLTYSPPTALRRIRTDERPHGRRGLPQGDVGPELRRLHRGRCREHHRRRAARRHQDAHPERELRDARPRPRRLP